MTGTILIPSGNSTMGRLYAEAMSGANGKRTAIAVGGMGSFLSKIDGICYKLNVSNQKKSGTSKPII